MTNATTKLPVTVLSGYPGAGKSPVPNHILNNRSGQGMITALDRLESSVPDHVIHKLPSADSGLLADRFSCLFELQSRVLRITGLTMAMCPNKDPRTPKAMRPAR